MVVCFTAISEIQPQALSTTPSTSTSSQLRNRAFPHHWSSDIYYISPLSISESGNDKTICLSATLSTGSSALSETSHEAIATRYARASHSRRNTHTLLRRPCSRTSYTTESRNSYTSSAESTPDESVRQNIELHDVESDVDSSAESRRIRLDSIGGDEIPFDPTKPKLDWNGRPFELVGAIPPFDDNDELNLQESNFNPFNDRFKIPHRKRTNESYTSLRHPSFDKRSGGIHRKYSAGIQRKHSGGIQRKHSYGGMQRKQSFGGGIQRKPPHSPIRSGSRRSSWQQPARLPSIHLVVSSAEPSSMGHTDRSESISEAETTVLVSMQSLGRDTSGWDRGYKSSEDRRFSAWGTSSEGPRQGIFSEEERRHSAWTTSERMSSHGWPNNEHYMHSSNSNVLSRPYSPKRRAKYSDNEEVESCRACVML